MSGMTITHSERGRDLWVSLGREWDENEGAGDVIREWQRN